MRRVLLNRGSLQSSVTEIHKKAGLIVIELVTVTFEVSSRIYAAVLRLPQDHGFLRLTHRELLGQAWRATVEPFRGFVIIEDGQDPVRIHVTRVDYLSADGVQKNFVCLTYDRCQMLAGYVPVVADYINIKGRLLEDTPVFVCNLELWLFNE